MSSVDTTPDYPRQPEAAVESAAGNLPAVLQEMPNETGYGASAPGHGQRVVLAQRLVDELARRGGHSRGAAAWAIHLLVERGLLLAEVGAVVECPVVSYRPDENSIVVRASGLFAHLADQPRYQVPVYGKPERKPLAPSDRPVPFDCLLVTSTPALWEWQQASAASPAGDGPRDVAELLAWCAVKMRVLAERVRAGGAGAALYDTAIHQIGRQADALARAFCPPELVLSLPVVPRTFPHAYNHHQTLTVLSKVSEWCRSQQAAPLEPIGQLADGTVPTADARPAGGTRPAARGGRDRKQEARDRWIYLRCCKGREESYDRIIAELKRVGPSKGWQVVSSRERIRQIGVEYADRHAKPRPPSRQNL